MSWILDVLLIALVAGTVIFYWHRGFVKTVLGFGRTLLSAIAAWLLGPKLGDFIAEKIIGNKITQKVYNMLAALFDNTADTINLEQVFEQQPEEFVATIERFGGNMAELEAKYGDMTNATRENLVDLAQSIAAPITSLISNMFGYLLVFLAVYILFVLLSGVLSKIFELPILKQLNRLLGLLLGLLIAALNAFIFCFIGSYVLKFLSAMTGKFVADALIEGTKLFQLIANIKLF